ncbi:hypothetical protein C8Q76DRAFT_696841 [Earliella scabrosa]|nr:hypothetical protein C8Q76DRAFT_696841 [Earliella scabrosa]
MVPSIVPVALESTSTDLVSSCHLPTELRWTLAGAGVRFERLQDVGGARGLRCPQEAERGTAKLERREETLPSGRAPTNGVGTPGGKTSERFLYGSSRHAGRSVSHSLPPNAAGLWLWPPGVDDPNDIIGVFDGPDDIRRRGDIPLTSPPPTPGTAVHTQHLPPGRESTPDLTDASSDESSNSAQSWMSTHGGAMWLDAGPLLVYAYARYPHAIIDGMVDDPRYTYIRARSLNYYLRISRGEHRLNIPLPTDPQRVDLRRSAELRLLLHYLQDVTSDRLRMSIPLTLALHDLARGLIHMIERVVEGRADDASMGSGTLARFGDIVEQTVPYDSGPVKDMTNWVIALADRMRAMVPKDSLEAHVSGWRDMVLTRRVLPNPPSGATALRNRGVQAGGDEGDVRDEGQSVLPAEGFEDGYDTIPPSMSTEYVHFYPRRRPEALGNWTLTSNQLDYFLRVEGPGGPEPIDHLDIPLFVNGFQPRDCHVLLVLYAGTSDPSRHTISKEVLQQIQCVLEFLYALWAHHEDSMHGVYLDWCRRIVNVTEYRRLAVIEDQSKELDTLCAWIGIMRAKTALSELTNSWRLFQVGVQVVGDTIERKGARATYPGSNLPEDMGEGFVGSAVTIEDPRERQDITLVEAM